MADAVASRDPNAKSGPGGFGEKGFIDVTAGSLAYEVEFENDAEATAPAQQVLITDQLDSDLDWRTLEFTQVAFGDTILEVPAGSQHFETTVPMTYDDVTFNVEIELGVNLETGELYARFLSIDPNTSLPPSVLVGFLPPEDGTGRGQGHVSYTVRAKTGLATGTTITNVASIQFDGGEIIATNQIDAHDPGQGTDPAKECLNTIDAGAPASQVASLPVQTQGTSVVVSWGGNDEGGAGSGIATYDIYVSDNGAAYTLWLPAITLTSATFSGESDHTYAFYSVARDRLGHVEAAPGEPDATTTMRAGLADLVGTAFDVSPDHMPGAETTVSYTVTNAGDGVAGAFDVNIVLSDNDVIGDSDDIVVATRSFAGLGAQASTSDSFVLTIPADARKTLYGWAKRDDAPSLPSGHVSTSYDYLGIVIDPAHAVSESNESNNANQGKGVDKDDVTYFPWDRDSSGQVTPTDAVFVINRLGQSIPPGDRRADPDGNGVVTPTDAVGAINRLGYRRNLSVDEAPLPTATLASAFVSDATVTELPINGGGDDAVAASPTTGAPEQMTTTVTINPIDDSPREDDMPATTSADTATVSDNELSGDDLSVYDPASSTWYFRNAADSGEPETVFGFGSPGAGWQPVFGDWDGDGVDTAGLYDPASSIWYLTNGTGSTDAIVAFGPAGAGWTPVVGDWDADGVDTLGLYDPRTSVWYLTNSLRGGYAEIVFGFGQPDAGWQPVAGDWDGNGSTGIGLYDLKSSTFYLTDALATGLAQHVFGYGEPNAGWKPLAGDWDGNNTASVGLYDPKTSKFYLTDTLGPGYAECMIGFGTPNAGWQPVVGPCESAPSADAVDQIDLAAVAMEETDSDELELPENDSSLSEPFGNSPGDVVFAAGLWGQA